MIYKSAYIYQSGAIECGDCIYATSDADAVLMGRGRAEDGCDCETPNTGLSCATGEQDERDK